MSKEHIVVTEGDTLTEVKKNIVWSLCKLKQLSTPLTPHAVESKKGETVIHVPSLVFAEILYLFDKGRIKTSLEWLENYLAQLMKNHSPNPFDLNSP